MQNDFDFSSWLEMSAEKAMGGFFVRHQDDRMKPQWWCFFESLDSAVEAAEDLAASTGNEREVVQILDTKFAQKVLATVAIDPETAGVTTFFY